MLLDKAVHSTEWKSLPRMWTDRVANENEQSNVLRVTHVRVMCTISDKKRS